MLLRTTLQVSCLSKENANNRDHNIMHDLGKSPRFEILYNLNLKNSVTSLKTILHQFFLFLKMMVYKVQTWLIITHHREENHII